MKYNHSLKESTERSIFSRSCGCSFKIRISKRSSYKYDVHVHSVFRHICILAELAIRSQHMKAITYIFGFRLVELERRHGSLQTFIHTKFHRCQSQRRPTVMVGFTRANSPRRPCRRRRCCHVHSFRSSRSPAPCANWSPNRLRHLPCSVLSPL